MYRSTRLVRQSIKVFEPYRMTLKTSKKKKRKKKKKLPLSFYKEHKNT
jgi:hypothetical protein